jgi:hypothetical protein
VTIKDTFEYVISPIKCSDSPESRTKEADHKLILLRSLRDFLYHIEEHFVAIKWDADKEISTRKEIK